MKFLVTGRHGHRYIPRGFLRARNGETGVLGLSVAESPPRARGVENEKPIGLDQYASTNRSQRWCAFDHGHIMPGLTKCKSDG